MPIDIKNLCEGWLELESDPGRMNFKILSVKGTRTRPWISDGYDSF